MPAFNVYRVPYRCYRQPGMYDTATKQLVWRGDHDHKRTFSIPSQPAGPSTPLTKALQLFSS